MVNPKSLDNLRPFKRGQSGNPGGLPKGQPKIGLALARFLSMPCRILDNYKPRSVAEEIAKRLIELATDGRGMVAIRAIKEVADRAEGKVGYATYVHYPNGETVLTYDGWQPPEIVMERGDVWDEQNRVLYPAGTVADDAEEVA
jgi:hypothetical protein